MILSMFWFLGDFFEVFLTCRGVCCGIPTRIVKEDLNIFATFLVEDIDTCIRKTEFAGKLKTADITPVFKKGDKHGKFTDP